MRAEAESREKERQEARSRRTQERPGLDSLSELPEGAKHSDSLISDAWLPELRDDTFLF